MLIKDDLKGSQKANGLCRRFKSFVLEANICKTHFLNMKVKGKSC